MLLIRWFFIGMMICVISKLFGWAFAIVFIIAALFYENRPPKDDKESKVSEKPLVILVPYDHKF